MAQGFDLNGKVVFITGAARGIGAESARQLVAKGASVALVGLEPEMLEQRSAELGTDRSAWFEADVTDLDALRAAAEATVERFGGIDVDDRQRGDRRLHARRLGRRPSCSTPWCA